MLTTVEKLHVNEGRTDRYTRYTKEGTALRIKMIFQKKPANFNSEIINMMSRVIVWFRIQRATEDSILLGLI